MDIIEKSSDGEDNKNQEEKLNAPVDSSFSFQKDIKVNDKQGENQKSESK